MFTKKDLKTGMFGFMYMDGIYTTFVVVNDNLVYQFGGYNPIEDFDDNMVSRYDENKYIYELRWENSFDRCDEGDLIFTRDTRYRDFYYAGE